MFQHLSSALFLLVVLVVVVVCHTGEPVCADSATQTRSVELFVPGKRKVHTEFGIKELEFDSKGLNSPFLVGANGLMLVFSEGDHKENGKISADLIVRYIGTEGTNWAESVTTGNGDKWTTQLVMQKNLKWNLFYFLKTPMAAIKGNKIYLLIVSMTANTYISILGHPSWEFELVVGDIKPKSEGQEGGKTITWQTPLKLTSLTESFKLHISTWPSKVMSTFLTENGIIVFVMKAERKGESGFAIIHSKEAGKETELVLSYAGSAEGCPFPHIFPWKNKLMMITLCPGKSARVKESADMGKTWINVFGQISFLWDNLQNKLHLTTAQIEGRNVLLFAQHEEKGAGNKKTYEMYLWVSDGNRVRRIGPFLTIDNYFISVGLLYTNGEFFFIHKDWAAPKKSIFLTHIREKTERIKFAVKTWAEKDEYFSKSCNETAPKGASLQTLCITPMPTEGLVGLLSDSTEGNVWIDEYLFMNATVKGGTKVKNGLTFNGVGFGAQWVVGKIYPDTRFNFTKYGLTLVLTVTIHEIPKIDSVHMLTTDGIWGKERPGLWYNKNKTWRLVYRNGTSTSFGSWEVDKTYRVAFVLRNNHVFAHIDGHFVGGPDVELAPGERLTEIERILIGGYEDRGRVQTFGHLTFTHVLLYSRVLRYTELKELDDTLGASQTKIVRLFLPGETEIPEKVGDVKGRKFATDFATSSLVAADGVMVAFAQAFYTDDDSANTDIVARYIGTEGEKWVREATEFNGDRWTTQLAMQRVEKDYTHQLKHSLAVGKGNKIYLLAVNYAMQKNNMDRTDWNFELTVGEIKPKSGGQEGGKTITWQTPLKLTSLTNDFKKQMLNKPSREQSAFLTEDGDIVFVLKVSKRRRDAFAIIHSKGTGKETELVASYVRTPKYCIAPYFFTWKKKVMMITRCQGGKSKVKESSDMGKTWTNSVWPMIKIWDSGQFKGALITATIEGKTVLLFAQRRLKITKTTFENQIRLSFTDGSRVHDVGPIIVDVFKDLVIGGLVYKDGELLLLSQKVTTEPDSIFLASLKGVLGTIKSVLKTWG